MKTIDPLCLPLIEYFNSVGLAAKFSCQGHDSPLKNEFYIMFKSEVSDEQIFNLILNFKNQFGHSALHGKFSKWARIINVNIAQNWEYRISHGDCALNQRFAKEDLMLFNHLN